MYVRPFVSLEGINLDLVSFEVKAMNGMFDQPTQQHQPRPGFPGRVSKPADHALIRDGHGVLDDEPPPLKAMKMDNCSKSNLEDFEMNLGQDEEEALVPVRDILYYIN